MKKTLAMLLALMLSLACLSFGYAEEAAPEQTEHIAGMLASSMGTEEDADEVARKNFPNLLFSNQFFPDLSSMLLALKAGKINSIALTSGKVDLI